MSVFFTFHSAIFLEITWKAITNKLIKKIQLPVTCNIAIMYTQTSLAYVDNNLQYFSGSLDSKSFCYTLIYCSILVLECNREYNIEYIEERERSGEREDRAELS